MADLKATALEGAVATSKRNAWQIATGAKATEGSSRKPTPTKVAYRWVRGIAKWTPAPIGATMLNDAFPLPPDEANDDNNLYVEHSGLLTNAVDPTLSPLCDQAFVDQTANAWAHLWQEKDMYIEPSFDVSKKQFSQLLP